MYVIFDTSAIYPDIFLLGTQFQILSSSRERLGLTLVMPQVVVDELINKQRQLRDSLEREWKSVEIAARQAFGKHHEPFQKPWESESVDYANYLEEFIKANRCKVLPYPSITHTEVVHRIRRNTAEICSIARSWTRVAGEGTRSVDSVPIIGSTIWFIVAARIASLELCTTCVSTDDKLVLKSLSPL
jgi:hypothetical protein